MTSNSFQWEKAVSKLSRTQVAALANRRGYRPNTVEWLSEQGWIGWSSFGGGRWCFPVSDGKTVVAAHQIPPEKGKPITYFPKGQGVFPLVIGEVKSDSPLFLFESQWDLIAALDAADFPKKPKGAFVATRGAANRLPPSFVSMKPKSVFAFVQNDPIKNGKSAAMEWWKGVQAQYRNQAIPVNTPEGFEDPQDWLLKKGIESFRREVREAMKAGKSAITDPKGGETDKPEIPDKPAPSVRIEGKSGLSDCGPDESEELENDPAPFPSGDLPDIAKRWARGFLEMTDGIMPPALPGICCLGTLSAAIGPGVRIRSTAAGDTTGANLYFLAAAESSSGKSIPFRRITNPFFSRESELRTEFQKDVFPRLKVKKETLEAEKKKLSSSTPGEETFEELVSIESQLMELEREMEPPRLFCGDSTSQAMIRLMARQTGQCLSSMSDDARTIMEMIEGKYNKGSNADDSLFIDGWTGSPFAYDRVTDRENIVMESPWLSALWFVQPDKLRSLAGNSETFQSGFFQRLLLCDTGATPLPFTDRENCFPDSLEREWQSLIEYLIDNIRRREEADPLIVQPSREARTLLLDFQNECVQRQRESLSDVSTIAGKWGENAWRLALLLHVADHPRDFANLAVSEETAKRAKRFVEWFSGEALRLVAPAREDREDERARQLRAILERPKYDREKGVSQGILRNNHGFKPEELETLCETFPSYFEKIDKGTTKKGGKPTFFVQLRH